MSNLDIFIRIFFASMFMIGLLSLMYSLINMQKSKIVSYPVIVIFLCLLLFSVIINIFSVSFTSIIYSEKLSFVVTALSLSVWTMFVFELNKKGETFFFFVHAFYSLLVSITFSILFYTSFNNELFFSSYEVYKFGEIKLVLYQKTLLYTVYCIYTSSVYMASAIYLFTKARKLDSVNKNLFIITGLVSFVLSISTVIDFFYYNVSIYFISPLLIAYTLYFNRFAYRFPFKGSTLSNTFASLNDPIILFDKNNKIINCSKSAYQAFPELEKKNLPISADFVSSIPLKDMLNGNVTSLKHIVPSTSERKLYTIVVDTIVSDSNYHSGKSILFYDDSAYRELQEKFISVSKFDFLTGVYNKAHFNTMGKRLFNTALSNDTNLSLVLFEIDGYKQIAQTYGYKLGDKLLKDTVSLAQKAFTSSSINEVYIFNLRIDRFAVIVTNSTTSGIYDTFESFRESIESTHIVSTTNIMFYTISGGVEVLQTTNAMNFDNFYLNAKNKLKKSLSDGGNKITTFIDEN